MSTERELSPAARLALEILAENGGRMSSDDLEREFYVRLKQRAS